MNKTIRIIGIPMDLGQNHRGVDMGPSAIRYAGLADRLSRLGYDLQDTGNLDTPLRYSLGGTENSAQSYMQAVCSACETAYQAGFQAISAGDIPLFLGGDHSIAIGTIGGVTHQRPTGVIWIDAHGDFNTPQTSQSGNIHGMPLAALLGFGAPALVNLGRTGPKLAPEDVVLIGLRDLDSKEKAIIKNSGITFYTMRDIDERGISAIMHEAISHLNHQPHLHVSLDMDCIDPMTAPGVGTPSPGGLTYREAQLIMEIIADSRKLASVDIVEINPVLDNRNQTACLAVELAASLFGKSII